MSDWGWTCLLLLGMTVVMYAKDIIKAWQGRDDE